MSSSLKIDIDVGHVLKLVQGLPPSAMQNAWRRTLRKTGNWIKGLTAKAVGTEMKVPQKLIRQRLYFFLRSRDSGKVWLGLNPLEANRLGAVRQTRTGVTAGRHRFAGAWRMDKRAPDGPVYQRVGKERLPYKKVRLDWGPEGEAAFRVAAARAEERLLIILKQEVNYELQKAIGRAR